MRFMKMVLIKEQPVDFVDQNVNRASKLMRTFTAQLEAMQRLRGTNQQKMTVEHVHVHEGGQAIVGNVVRREGGKHEDGG